MDDNDSAALRRRAQDAGLGGDLSQMDDQAVSDLVGWAAPTADGLPGPTLSRLSPRATVAAAAPPPAAPARPRVAEAAAPASTPLLSLNIDAAALAQALRESGGIDVEAQQWRRRR